MPTITLTNGAAHWGVDLLGRAKCSLVDLFTSGSLAKLFRKAALVPNPEEGEQVGPYNARVTEWFDAPFGDVEVSQEERDYMRSLLKGMGERKELPGNFHVATLAKAFELDKP